MHEKLRVGDMEIVRPDENMIRITEEILSQNNKIIEMNAGLLISINSPALIIKKTEDD